MSSFKSAAFRIALCLAFGLYLAFATRASHFITTLDFQYFNMPFYDHASNGDFDFTHMGKNVIGESGFPFSTYANCEVGIYGTTPSVRCGEYSRWGEWSILLNVVFWSSLALGLIQIAGWIKARVIALLS